MDNSIQAHQKELCNKLWAMANALRGNMEAYEFKNYILGMIFYYYLSLVTRNESNFLGKYRLKHTSFILLIKKAETAI